MCPAGSSGSPQNGHGGRPAPTTAAARSAKARATAGLSRTRSTSRSAARSDVRRARASASVVRSSSVDAACASITSTPASPSQTSAIVPTRNSSSIGRSSGAAVLQSGGRDRGRAGSAGAPQHLVEQLVDPLGQGRDLLLLQRDAGHAAGRRGPGGRTSARRARRRCRRRTGRAGRTRRPAWHGHDPKRSVRAGPSAHDGIPAVARPSSRPRPRGGGSSASTPPPVSFIRTTNGRSSV